MEKLKENVKRDTRKLLKTFGKKNNLKIKNNNIHKTRTHSC